MIVLGLTGGMGSGKSTVSKALAGKGARIIDADQIAREVVEPGSPILGELAKAFGDDVVVDGILDRSLLASRAFADESHTRLLNKITHPEIRRRIEDCIVQAQKEMAQVVVLDHPLLLEQDLVRDVDLVAVVDVPVETRLQRLVAFRNIDEQDARKRIARQMSDSKRLEKADVILDNSRTIAELESQIETLWEKLLQEALSQKSE
ncbi:dephospho-CoA kinase [Corynebacterium pseudotuberculosis]|uniref:Dephospho-CoA kinase n=1 Tax=Corynebacterium pseudotuberculosis 258 TaxID=1168865 RepID=A0AAU8PL05_CORPS|nr:dephospho-CoA kinase [Corynebacterium pseudotuberculosis]AEQ06493.2 dephospho-CoA kinase [Corynebacterium pseudotuberculosis CIP 52.97]AFB72288.2 dephospho-CoA kinase [Corynebacterium pseudotuberculosis 316]AFH90761.2 dephospho-CoA kinase [Corynebacterium pseudotuberculosis 31]AFK16584.2 dephospho-CoA kinase [Corynebacterium pseudotuberculosis 258]AMN69926.2 dephospho-CoA kinase [Corynebacterium pseudotuberculosis]